MSTCGLDQRAHSSAKRLWVPPPVPSLQNVSLPGQWGGCHHCLWWKILDSPPEHLAR
jgi:hypothetical protein